MLIFILLYQNINYSEIRKLERNLNANLQVDKGGRGVGGREQGSRGQGAGGDKGEFLPNYPMPNAQYLMPNT
ncbi:MAG: hypothetical protein ACRAVC_03800 [Trichormus sp.]